LGFKEEFIELMVRSGVLKFGNFITKSGRQTPFFINTGNYISGKQLSLLGNYYAKAIYKNFGDNWDVLFGPAYKGITLSALACSKFYELYGIEKKYCFNRKEVKDHGEGGSLVGYIPQDDDRVIIVEDVITAGTSVRESVELLAKVSKAKVIGLVVSVDRKEKGEMGKSAIQEVSEKFSLKAVSIVDIDEIVSYLYNNKIEGKQFIDEETKKRIDEYRKMYGV
jgi:orotate phosphoribosyltransferase